MPIALIGDRTVLFVHIPKTGGSTIETYLAQHGRLSLKNADRNARFPCSAQHLHAEPLTMLHPDKEFDWAFTVVRHPVARIVSEYRYQMRKRRWLRDRLSFSGWLTYALARRRLDPYYRDNHFRPQHEFEIAGAEVFRFEDGIDRCLDAIAARLQIPAPSAPIREKRSPHASLAIREPDLRRLEEVYRVDFQRYGYGLDRGDLMRVGLTEEMLA